MPVPVRPSPGSGACRILDAVDRTKMPAETHQPSEQELAQVLGSRVKELRERKGLVDSRYRPELPFEPTHSNPLVHLEWDEIEPRTRASICVEVGAEEASRCAGKELKSDRRDFISWRFEVLRRVRIEFTPQDREGPPAA